MPSTPTPSASPSLLAQQRLLSRMGEPLFFGGWHDAMFLHFETDPVTLQRQVPYPLDLWEGRAFVSLVAFTMRGLRFARGGKLTELLTRPIASHPFLNVRTYVKQGDEPGIYFLAEWMTNPLSVHLGRPLFGLPYRLGEAHYEHRADLGHATGEIRVSQASCFRYSAKFTASDAVPCEQGSLEEFLVERYTCFTQWRQWRRLFRVWHEPWPIVAAELDFEDHGFLTQTGGWAEGSHFHSAQYSPGFSRVSMGRPLFIPKQQRIE